jgi:hypothetical protein
MTRWRHRSPSLPPIRHGEQLRPSFMLLATECLRHFRAQRCHGGRLRRCQAAPPVSHAGVGETTSEATPGCWSEGKSLCIWKPVPVTRKPGTILPGFPLDSVGSWFQIRQTIPRYRPRCSQPNSVTKTFQPGLKIDCVGRARLLVAGTRCSPSLPVGARAAVRPPDDPAHRNSSLLSRGRPSPPSVGGRQ